MMQQQVREPLTELPQRDENYEIGLIFVSARQELGMSVEDVAQTLHIRKTYIIAIEEGNFSVLPGQIYAWGFIKKYAEFLGLDFYELQRRLHIETKSYAILTVEDLYTPYTSSNYKKYMWLSGVMIFIVISCYTYLNVSQLNQSEVREQIELPPPDTDSHEGSPPVASEPTQESLPSATQEPVKPVTEDVQPTLAIHAIYPSWVNIRDAEGKTILSRILQKNEKYVFPHLSGLILDVGNAGGIELIKGDKVLPSLGSLGQVRKGISVDNAFK